MQPKGEGKLKNVYQNRNNHNDYDKENKCEWNGYFRIASRSTIEYLGVWEQLHNPEFKRIEFDAFRQQAGLN